MKKSVKKDLMWLFVLVLAVKVLVSFFMEGPTVFSDESCVAQKAMHFLKYFEIENCDKIVQFDAGGLYPLYSILISPLYLLFHGKASFYAVLAFNSLLFSSLVFPLYHILKRYLTRDFVVYWMSLLILFLSQLFVYEKMILTEGLFIVLNIWFLYFYLNSFDAKRAVRNKVFAVVMAVLAAITRPFGFILLLAIAVNELVLSKKKVKSLLILTPVLLLTVAVAVWFFMPFMDKYFGYKIASLYEPGSWKLMLTAIVNQINSFTIATFLIPVVVFVTYVWRDKKLRWFLISFIAMNFLISAQHIYGYLLLDDDINLLTRYVNMSIIYILIFALLFLNKYKDFKFKWWNAGLAVLLLVCFYFLGEESKRVQNIDISAFYVLFKGNNYTDIFIYSLRWYLLGIYAVLLGILALGRVRFVKWGLIVCLLLLSYFSVRWIALFPYESEIEKYLIQMEDKKITYVVTAESPKLLGAWKILALTDNSIDYVYINPYAGAFDSMDTDFLVTTHDLSEYPLMAYCEESGLGVYKKR